MILITYLEVTAKKILLGNKVSRRITVWPNNEYALKHMGIA